MKIGVSLILCACALLSTSANSQPGGWRGIVPLHSTRADVERLLGKPTVEPDIYDLGNGRASFVYSGEPCTGGWVGSYNVPRDTVISIHIIPQTDLALSDLHLDLGKYKLKKNAPLPDHSVYENADEGLTYIVQEQSGGNSLVSRIVYAPAKKDAGLLCPNAAAEQPSQSDGDCSPEGECPDISIKVASGKPCRSQRLTFAANIAGTAPRLTPTYQWSVSPGRVTKGQGTSAVEVDVSDACGKPVTVTLAIGCVIPKGCISTRTYTARCSANDQIRPK